MKKLSKTLFLKGLQCPLRLWRASRDIPECAPEEEEFEDADDFVEESRRVEEWARQLFAGSSRDQVRVETVDCEAIIDILLPEDGGHRLIEVKASSGVKPIFSHDLAFQWVVAEESGLDIRGADVIHVNSAYVYPGGIPDPQLGLVRVDCTNDVRALLDQTRASIHSLVAQSRSAVEPVEAPGKRCRAGRDSAAEVRPSDCGHFERGGLCRERKPEDWAFFIPRLQGAKVARVFDGNPDRRMSELDPDDHAFGWTSAQRRVIRAARENSSVLDVGVVRTELAALRTWPLTFLDFEFEPAIAYPRFVGMRPNQKMPFQWSLRIQRAHRAELEEEKHYVHPDGTDPRERFMTTLLAALPPAGQIIVYHAPAESSVLNLLGQWFGGSFAVEASGIVNRMFDLLPVVRESFAHPSMLGSFSLKKVAPAMLQRGYSDLDIQDGMTAVRSWRQMIDPNCPVADRNRVERQLRSYCGRDAELMHEILEWLLAASA